MVSSLLVSQEVPQRYGIGSSLLLLYEPEASRTLYLSKHMPGPAGLGPTGPLPGAIESAESVSPGLLVAIV